MKKVMSFVFCLTMASISYAMHNHEVISSPSLCFWTQDAKKGLVLIDNHFTLWDVEQKKIIGGYVDQEQPASCVGINRDATLLASVEGVVNERKLSIVSLANSTKQYTIDIPSIEKPFIVYDDASDDIFIANDFLEPNGNTDPGIIDRQEILMFNTTTKQITKIKDHNSTMTAMLKLAKGVSLPADLKDTITAYLQTNNVTNIVDFIKQTNNSNNQPQNSNRIEQLLQSKAAKIFGISSLVAGGVLAVGGICYWVYNKIKNAKKKTMNRKKGLANEYAE